MTVSIQPGSFPPAIQNAVNLFNEVDPSDWDKAVELLKQNRSEYALDALAQGCEHDTKGVRIKCAFALAEKSNYQDTRCKPIFVELVDDIVINDLSGLPADIMKVVSNMKITEAQDKIFEYIVYKTRQDQYIFSEDHIDFILNILENIITSEGLEKLYFILKNDLQPSSPMRKNLESFIRSHDGMTPSQT